MIPLVDCHTHTIYSDGKSTVAENVRQAQALGLKTICVTDHLTLPYELDPTCEVSVREDCLGQLHADVEHARTLYPSIDIVFGFECDYYPHCESNILKWSRGSTFRLGSVHAVDGRWIDDLSDLSFWEEAGTDYIWKRYFSLWYEACESGIFDSMAHPDLVSILGRYPDESLLEGFYRNAAECARENRVHIEVNTAGIIKPVGRYYPHPVYLEHFSKAGVPITFGSDAHHFQRIGEGITEAYELAYRCGYSFFDVPKSDGDWYTVSLD